MGTNVELRPMGPSAVLVQLADRSPAAVASAIRDELASVIVDVVPAASTVLVRLSPSVVADQRLFDRLATVVDSTTAVHEQRRGRTIEVPVVYDGEDLVEVASTVGLSVSELIFIHGEHPHTAAFCGFSPGFAYLEVADPRLNIPRRSTPRTRVSAGSVALAAGYTAVYPVDSPGGWHVIGHTSLKMWDPSRSGPSLVEPGDHVRFIPT